jgi:hypothetical protein
MDGSIVVEWKESEVKIKSSPIGANRADDRGPLAISLLANTTFA